MLPPRQTKENMKRKIISEKGSPVLGDHNTGIPVLLTILV
jgi:hypothetical protein